tara:strand:- start:1785 stop:4052 length:2268 start_codon:yes stop_codon:yes gene_type:complete
VNTIELIAPATISVENVGAGSFQIQGTVAGTYEVACRLEDIVDPTPVSFLLLPGLAHSWSVSIPSEDCNKPGTAVDLAVEASDIYGNEIEDPDYTVVSNPPGLFSELIDGTLMYAQDGNFEMTVAYAGELDPANEIDPAVFNIHLDGQRPSLVITAPSRAATLVGTTGETITIQGTVQDNASDIVALEVNGTAVAVEGNSFVVEFSEDHVSRWGLNIISAWAEDACGLSVRTVQSYLHSPSYFSASTIPKPSSAVPQGIVGRLNQAFLDDPNPLNPNDIAQLAIEVLWATDIDAMLPSEPDPVAVDPDTNDDGEIDTTTHSCGFWTETNQETGFRAVKTGVLDYDLPVIDYVRAVDGGIVMAMHIDNISMPLSIYGHLDVGCLGENGATANGTLNVDRISLLVDADVFLANGEPQILTCEDCVSLTFEELYFDVDWGMLDFMGGALDGIANFIIDRFEGTLAEKLSDVISYQVIPIIEDFLGQFSVDTDLPLLPMLDVDLSIISAFDYVEFSGPEGAGHGTLGLATQVYPSSQGFSVPAGSKGSIKRGGELPTFSSNGYTFGVGLSDDLINQLLWALWYGGGLDIPDATGLLGQNFPDLELAVRANAPPVLMPGDDEHEIYVGVGDVFVDAVATIPPFGLLDAGLYASVIVPGRIDVDPTTNTLMFTVTGDVDVQIELTALEKLDAFGDLQAYFEGVLALLTPNLLQSSIGLVPLPVFDVGGLLGIPTNVVWGLDNPLVTRLPDYTRFTGNVTEQ